MDSDLAVHAVQDTEELRSPERGANDALTVLIAVPTLDRGAADAGAVQLACILATAGHHPIVASCGGRLERDVTAAGGEIIRLDMASQNPVTTIRNSAALVRLIRERRCRVVHAHGRAAAWSAFFAARITRVPFLTTWYKGFREQNVFKHMYNGVMARGDRVFAVSDQIAELIVERYDTPPERIVATHASIDYAHFDPAAVDDARVERVRRAWGVGGDTRIVLVTGRMVRRKGHHVVVQAAQRLKERGFKDFICVFTGEDQGRTRYTGELWDLVLATGTADVIRMAGSTNDLPAAYAAASVVVSGAIQAEGLQRGILEALAMARPVIVSDLAAGPEVVQAPPLVPEERMSGLRVPAGDDAALAAALIRLLSLPDASRRAIGSRGRDWVTNHFDPDSMVEQTLAVYGEVARGRRR
jgi:glycosyltransferase involved in cell wall biosynthesis